MKYISEYGFTEPFEGQRTDLFRILDDTDRTSMYFILRFYVEVDSVDYRLLHELPRRSLAGHTRGRNSARRRILLGCVYLSPVLIRRTEELTARDSHSDGRQRRMGIWPEYEVRQLH